MEKHYVDTEIERMKANMDRYPDIVLEFSEKGYEYADADVQTSTHWSLFSHYTFQDAFIFLHYKSGQLGSIS